MAGFEPEKGIDAAAGELAKQGSGFLRKWIADHVRALSGALVTGLVTSGALLVEWPRTNPGVAVAFAVGSALILLLMLDKREKRLAAAPAPTRFPPDAAPTLPSATSVAGSSGLGIGSRARGMGVEGELARIAAQLTPRSPLGVSLLGFQPPTWSHDHVRFEMQDPLYDTSGQFLAELILCSATPFPGNSRLKSLFVEARSDGSVLGQYRYNGPQIGPSGTRHRIGKVLVPIRDDAFRLHVVMEISRDKLRDVKIDLLIRYELVVPGVPDQGSADYHVHEQFCGIRDTGLAPEEKRGALPPDMT